MGLKGKDIRFKLITEEELLITCRKPPSRNCMGQLRKIIKIQNIQTHAPDVGNGW
jgi:hypothetical protein